MTEVFLRSMHVLNSIRLTCAACGDTCKWGHSHVGTPASGEGTPACGDTNVWGHQQEAMAGVFTLSFVCYVQVLYFTYGTKDVLERECKHLDKKLKVRASLLVQLSS